MAASKAPSRRKTPEAGRVFVVWTHPVTGRRRLFGEPIEELAADVLEKCRGYLERFDFESDDARDAAIASARIER